MVLENGYVSNEERSFGSGFAQRHVAFHDGMGGVKIGLGVGSGSSSDGGIGIVGRFGE